MLRELTVPEVAPADVAKAMIAYVERFEARVGWTRQMLEEEAAAWCTQLGWKTKHAYMLLRVAITGRTATPPLFETMEVLGKELTRRRLRRAAEAIAKGSGPKVEPPAVTRSAKAPGQSDT